MASPIDLATAIASAIDKAAELVAQILSGAAVRKLKYRVDAAMQYVFVDEKAGYADIDEKRQKALKLHYRKRIFDT